MVSDEKIKKFIAKNLSKKEKILIVLGSNNGPCQVKDIREKALKVGIRRVNKWNISQLLADLSENALRTNLGWEISEHGIQKLESMGVFDSSPAVTKVAIDFKSKVANIKDKETREYSLEAIICFEHDLYNSTIVLSWLSAIYVLQKFVFQNHLRDFNIEAKRRNSRWKVAKTIDDIAEMKERDFLDILHYLSIIGKNLKKELINCLERRNSCGHPNSLIISQNTVAHHIEILLNNVFVKPFV